MKFSMSRLERFNKTRSTDLINVIIDVSEMTVDMTCKKTPRRF